MFLFRSTISMDDVASAAGSFISKQPVVLANSEHGRKELCTTRLPYRDGKKLKAVKVFTVCNESIYLLVHHVPALDLHEELRTLFGKFGEVEESRILHEYPAEQFAQVHLFKFKKVASSRLGKVKMDDYNFHGAILHVHYAPELETIQETAAKLENRRREVGFRLWRNEKDSEERRERRKRRFDQLDPPSELSPAKKKPIYGPAFNPFQK